MKKRAERHATRIQQMIENSLNERLRDKWAELSEAE